MKLGLPRLLLISFVAIGDLWAQSQPLNIKVNLYVKGGSHDAQDLVAERFSEAIKRVRGVTLPASGVHADYVMILEIDDRRAGDGQNLIALGISVLDRTDPDLLLRMYIQSDHKKEMLPLEAIANLTPRLTQTAIRVGSAEDIQQMCRDLVELIDGDSFEKERHFPHGSRTFDEAYRNFVARSGATPH